MTIGIDASRANHAQKTGVEWYAWSIIQELKISLPNTVRVILYSDTPLTGPLADLPAHWQSKVLRWPPRRFWTQIRLSVEMFLHRPDVLFIPAHVFPIIHPQKTVMMIHDVAALTFPTSYSWFERWYSLATARYARRHLWRVLVPSDCTKQALESLIKTTSTSGAQIRVVPHGYNEQYGKIVPQAQMQQVRQTYHLDRPYLLFIGRLEEKKNTAMLVRAFTVVARYMDTINRPLDLVLVGMPGFGYSEVVSAIAESPHKDRIRLLGWLGESEVVPLMQGAEAFVFPSRYEGFGIPLLEAMAARTVVVTLRGAGAIEEVGGEAVHYVTEASPAALARAIQDVLSDQALANILRDRGGVRVAEFSWAKAGVLTAAVLTGY